MNDYKHLSDDIGAEEVMLYSLSSRTLWEIIIHFIMRIPWYSLVADEVII
jgi:hypothetical protein